MTEAQLEKYGGIVWPGFEDDGVNCFDLLWPEPRGMSYKQLTEAYKEVTCTYGKLINRASLEIYRRGDLVDDTLQEKRALV